MPQRPLALRAVAVATGVIGNARVGAVLEDGCTNHALRIYAGFGLLVIIVLLTKRVALWVYV
jgi:hypothetical protein